MKKSTVITLIMATLALVCLVLYVGFLQPQFELSRRVKINERMKNLILRCKSTPQDREALAALIQGSQSKNSFEQTAAVVALGQVGSDAAPAVDSLINALNGSNLYAAREAAMSIGRIGPGAHRAIPELIRAVKQRPNYDIGWFSAEALGQIVTHSDPEVVSVLQAATNSSSESMRYSAASALRHVQSRPK